MNKEDTIAQIRDTYDSILKVEAVSNDESTREPERLDSMTDTELQQTLARYERIYKRHRESIISEIRKQKQRISVVVTEAGVSEETVSVTGPTDLESQTDEELVQLFNEYDTAHEKILDEMQPASMLEKVSGGEKPIFIGLRENDKTAMWVCKYQDVETCIDLQAKGYEIHNGPKVVVPETWSEPPTVDQLLWLFDEIDASEKGVYVDAQAASVVIALMVYKAEGTNFDTLEQVKRRFETSRFFKNHGEVDIPKTFMRDLHLSLILHFAGKDTALTLPDHDALRAYYDSENDRKNAISFQIDSIFYPYGKSATVRWCDELYWRNARVTQMNECQSKLASVNGRPMVALPSEEKQEAVTDERDYTVEEVEEDFLAFRRNKWARHILSFYADVASAVPGVKSLTLQDAAEQDGAYITPAMLRNAAWDGLSERDMQTHTFYGRQFERDGERFVPRNPKLLVTNLFAERKDLVVTGYSEANVNKVGKVRVSRNDYDIMDWTDDLDGERLIVVPKGKTPRIYEVMCGQRLQFGADFYIQNRFSFHTLGPSNIEYGTEIVILEEEKINLLSVLKISVGGGEMMAVDYPTVCKLVNTTMELKLNSARE